MSNIYIGFESYQQHKTMKFCSKCNGYFDFSEFTQSQWKKTAGSRKCRQCLDEINLEKEVLNFGIRLSSLKLNCTKLQQKADAQLVLISTLTDSLKDALTKSTLLGTTSN
jgi:hypothetical protein